MDAEFRRTVVDISHALSSYDLEQIVYLFGIPEQDTKMRPLTVLKQLERDGHFSATKPEGLERMLQDIHRSDLSGRVQDYCSRFKGSTSCCRFSCSFCKRLNELIELCLAQSTSTYQRIKDLFQGLEEFSNNHRRTSTTEKFCQEMEENFKSVLSDFSKFHMSPLQDLHKLATAGTTNNIDKEDSKQVASDRVKPTSLSKPILADQLDAGSMEDYDSLESLGTQDKFGGRPLTATTRIPIPIRKPSGHNPLCDSPVVGRRRGPGGSPKRGRSRDYDSSSYTDDSGFAELRSLHSHHSTGYLVAGRQRNDSLPHAWRESREYTSLDLATTNNQSEYMDMSRRRKK